MRSRPSVYDQLRHHLDASDLIARLGLKESRRLGSEAYCAPLCHESTSGESLQINLHTGRWNCKACQHAGVSGDLVQLVEYVLSGGRAPSHGSAQGGNESHRVAVRWLCGQYGVAFDESRESGDAALDVVHLFAMLAHEYLLGAAGVLEWIGERWGFDDATVRSYGIGFMPSPLLPALQNEARTPSSRGAFTSSGLGWYGSDGLWHTRFEGRVTFPYLEHGRAVYLIGRATPWTPALPNAAKPPKYHKLPVHSETRPHISASITNDHLYNEPVMGSVDSVVVAEGVADAVALSSIGVPVVSPVTISFNATDLERFTRKARESGVRRVDVLFDNELSGSGNFAARRVGRQLVERGLVARVVTLPLGEVQQAARDEVVAVLGADVFRELEQSDPLERKKLIAGVVPDESQRAWVLEQIAASKIDAAEWIAAAGAGAIAAFDDMRKRGRDVVALEIEDVVAEGIDPALDPGARAAAFDEVIGLVAHVDDGLARDGYAGDIARAAGRGVRKPEIQRRIALARKLLTLEEREEAKREERQEPAAAAAELVLLPPQKTHNRPPAPPPPSKGVASNAPPAPPPPGEQPKSEHEYYAAARDAVQRGVEAKLAAEQLGAYVSQTMLVSMGFTPFRTPEELYLVRGSERVPVGLDKHTPQFETLLFLASGLTPKRSSHRPYIAACVYFLGKAARTADDVSWSFVAPDGAVFFPTGDAAGRMLKIEPGRVTRTRMSESRVPAVAGAEFEPIEYVDRDGGVQAAFDAFRWTSISPSDRLVLVHWIVCLPVLRRVGVVPIIRIEGGSSSGKTRTVDAISYLVNGRRSSSVPTAAALGSRMSVEMLTVDDNRESADVSPALLGTLLQATHLGAREKRKGNTDTGTVVERICGALVMNGVEPIHDGRSEIASRMLTLRCDPALRAPDSPTAERQLREAVVQHRNAFWSEAVRLCAAALLLDEEHGEHVGGRIEAIFGATKIGRLSAYLRIMYLSWVARLPEDRRAPALDDLAPIWRTALAVLGQEALDSLLMEELAVSCLRYAFAWGAINAKAEAGAFGSIRKVGLEGLYVESSEGEVFFGPLRATRLARIVRHAGRELNAPQAISQRLRAGQLEQRLVDGIGFLEAAGFQVSVERTQKGLRRFTFLRTDGAQGGETDGESAAHASTGGETWQAP